MTFLQAIKSGYANYINFSGRAIRSEYWYFVLFTVIAAVATELVDVSLLSSDVLSGSPLNKIFNLVTFLPSLGLCIRRLHDIDRTGWWVLIAFTVIGAFLLIYWACVKGTDGPNRFGPDKLAANGQFIPPPRA
jgi:uncharacterized membrane protein YhaH (DUF805 family)